MALKTSLPDSLIARICNRRLVPFVGAGASMAVRLKNGDRAFPSWRELLTNAVDLVKKENKIQQALIATEQLQSSNPNYPAVAQLCKDTLGSLWYDFLQKQLDIPASAIDAESLSLNRRIWSLRPRLIITTNYDRTLEWSVPDELRTGYETWNVAAPPNQALTFRDGFKKDVLWHLHGSISDMSRIVLTPETYEGIYRSTDNSALASAVDTLRIYASQFSLLFVGFSMEDPYVRNEFERLVKVFHNASTRHYMLVSSDSYDRTSELTKNANIEVIPYERHGGPLLDVFDSLASHLTPSGGGDHSTIYSLPVARQLTRLPYAPNRDSLIGRSSDLRTIVSQLIADRPRSRRISLIGVTGVGKTRLAVEAMELLDPYFPGGIIWLTCDRSIDQQLAEVALEQKWVPSTFDQRTAFDESISRLGDTAARLIILDNVLDSSLTQRLTSTCGPNTSLFATCQIPVDGFESYILGPLSPKDSAELLLAECGIASTADVVATAKELARELGNVPLTLKITSEFIRSERISIRECLLRLQKELNENDTATLDALHPKNYEEVLKRIIIHTKANAIEREIVATIACSGGGPLDLSTLAFLLHASPRKIATYLNGDLCKIVLDSSQGGYPGVFMHRLVRNVIMKVLSPYRNTVWVQRKLSRLMSYADHVCGKTGRLGAIASLEPLFNAWYTIACSNGHQSSQSRLSWLKAIGPFQRGQYGQAFELVSVSTTEKRLFGTMRTKPMRGRDELDLLIIEGNCQTALGGYSARQAGVAYRKAARKADGLGCYREFAALRGVWMYNLTGNSVQKAMVNAEQLLRVARRAKDKGMLIEAERAMGHTVFWIESFGECSRWNKLVWQHYIANPGSVSRIYYVTNPGVSSLAYRGMAEHILGNYELSERLAAQAIGQAEAMKQDHSLANSLIFRAITRASVGDLDGVRSDAIRAIDVSEHDGFVYWLTLAGFLVKWAEGMAGNNKKAFGEMAKYITNLSAGGGKLLIPMMMTLTSDVCRVSGDTKEAATWCKKALIASKKSGDLSFRLEIKRRQALISMLGADSLGGVAQMKATIEECLESSNLRTAALATMTLDEGGRDGLESRSLRAAAKLERFLAARGLNAKLLVSV